MPYRVIVESSKQAFRWQDSEKNVDSDGRARGDETHDFCYCFRMFIVSQGHLKIRGKAGLREVVLQAL